MRIVTVGDEGLLTEARRERIIECMRVDPRVATISLVSAEAPSDEFVAATSPAGAAVAISPRLHDLVGPAPTELTSADPYAFAGALHAWAREASNRGFRHLWWMTHAADVAASTTVLPLQPQDRRDALDPTSAIHVATHPEPGAGITLTVHAGWLGPNQTGAQVLITEAVTHLARDPRISSIRLVGLDRLPVYAGHLHALPNVSIGQGREWTHEIAAISSGPTDIVWYPNQPDRSFDLREAKALGRRTIVTYLDLIAYDIALYHASEEDWNLYRGLQRRASLAVDGVATISRDVATLLHEQVPFLEASRVRAVPLGVDHLASREHGAVLQHDDDLDELESALEGRRFVLVFGNDFVHKNRDFAVRVWDEVVSRGFDGDLVLAGLHVGRKGSRSHEARIRSAQPHRIHSVGHVTPRSREWLLSNAAAALYPTSAEGFGLIPYEAAALGTPVVFTAFGPLMEISPLDDVPREWSIEAYAADLSNLLDSATSAGRRVTQLRAVGKQLTWNAFADGMVTFFSDIAAMPASVHAGIVELLTPPPSGIDGASWSWHGRRAMRRAVRSLPWLARQVHRRNSSA